jgi:hypothetical protein
MSNEFFARSPVLIVFTIGILTGNSISSVRADERIATQAAVFRNDVAPLLKGYCINCHGATKPEAELSLQDLSGAPVGKSVLEIWSRVADKIESGEMPPREADQPSVEQRFRMVRWIKQTLRNAGVVDERSAAPSRGNWIDHDALFSSKPVEVAGGSATQARLLRLSGQAYEEFIQQKNLQFKLGFRNYGDHKIRSPWNFTPQWDFSDYAASHRIGEAEIEYHMRNAAAVAKAMVKRMAGRRPSTYHSSPSRRNPEPTKRKQSHRSWPSGISTAVEKFPRRLFSTGANLINVSTRLSQPFRVFSFQNSLPVSLFAAAPQRSDLVVIHLGVVRRWPSG